MEEKVVEKRGEEEDIVDVVRELRLSEQEIYKQSLQEKDKKINDLYSQLLRAKADFENYRKRVENEKKLSYKYGKLDIIQKLLPFLDIFDNVLLNLKKVETIDKLVDGIELIQKEFQRFLEKEGVKEIKTINEKFDYKLHEVVETEPRDDIEEGTIISELQKGYTYEDFVIRPAKVKIAVLQKTTEIKSEDHE